MNRSNIIWPKGKICERQTSRKISTILASVCLYNKLIFVKRNYETWPRYKLVVHLTFTINEKKNSFGSDDNVILTMKFISLRFLIYLCFFYTSNILRSDHVRALFTISSISNPVFKLFSNAWGSPMIFELYISWMEDTYIELQNTGFVSTQCCE